MLKNYLTIAYRNLLRDRLYALINIAGLTVGMACCMLALLYVQHELSYDGFHRNAGRIFGLVSTAHSAHSGHPPPLAPMLVDQEPHIQQAVRIRNGGLPLLSADEVQFHHQVYAADAGLFSIFDFEFVTGDPQTALLNPNSMVVSTEMATRFFGDENPLGKTVRWDTSHEYRITGVVDVPSNTHLSLDITVSMSALYNDPTWKQYIDVDSWHRNGYADFYIYLLLDKPQSAIGLPGRVAALLAHSDGQVYANRLKEAGQTLYLQPLEDIHLHSNLRYELKGNGDISHVYIMSAIAAFLLFIACINFVNLSTARALSRAREVGIRKAVGAQKRQLIEQFFSESTLVVLAAAAISLGLLNLSLPTFSAFIGIEFHLMPGKNPQALLVFAAIVLSTGVLNVPVGFSTLMRSWKPSSTPCPSKCILPILAHH